MYPLQSAQNPFIPTVSMTNKPTRLVKDVEVDMPFIERVLKLLNLTAASEYSVPENGRIASNVSLNTHEMGEVLLRFYPEGYHTDKLETGNVDFEIETLHYLSSHGIAVPQPLLFEQQKFKWEENGIKIFAYRLLPGNSLKITDLSPEIALKSGQFLKTMIELNEKYPASHDAPEGDLNYFLKIYQLLLAKHPELQNFDVLKEMAHFTAEFNSINPLSNTPKGIVHADFFFENILVTPEGSLCTIDFGDAYYGHVIMDIAIGSMEFCVLEDRSWDLEMFKNFLQPHASWLREYNVTSHTFHSLLASNCLRFAIYTLPGTLEEGLAPKLNPYIIRFKDLMKNPLQSDLMRVYENLIS